MQYCLNSKGIKSVAQLALSSAPPNHGDRRHAGATVRRDVGRATVRSQAAPKRLPLCV